MPKVPVKIKDFWLLYMEATQLVCYSENHYRMEKIEAFKN